VLGRFEAWVASALAEGVPLERLRRLLRYLVDAHRELPHIGRAQITNLALKDEPERAAERLFELLLELLAEVAPGWGEARARVAAASLQASVTWLSIVHGRFTPMTGIPVDTPAQREAFVDALLEAHGLAGGAP
jgi:hypothetical protein